MVEDTLLAVSESEASVPIGLDFCSSVGWQQEEMGLLLRGGAKLRHRDAELLSDLQRNASCEPILSVTVLMWVFDGHL